MSAPYTAAVANYAQARTHLANLRSDYPDDLSDGEEEHMIKYMKIELEHVRRGVGPARPPPAEGTKGAQVAAILKQCMTAEWNTVPIHTAGSCKEVRDHMLWTLGEWYTAAGGAHGGGDPRKQSYHSKDAEGSILLKVK